MIHASWTQALPPRALFGNLPVLVVTADGRVLTQGPVREIYPGPLVAPFVERPISPNGVAALLQAAKDAGLLGPATDFTGGAMPMGAAAARLQIVVDGVTHDFVGDANAAVPCPPTQACPEAVPGTPAAFARFWYRLLDMAGWLESELGPEQPYTPASYAVIVGPPPEPWEGADPGRLARGGSSPGRLRRAGARRAGDQVRDRGGRPRGGAPGALRRGDAADPVRGHGNGQRDARADRPRAAPR